METSRKISTASLGLLLSLAALGAHADGHGPAFALATPTLAEGLWSSDTAAMSTDTGMGTALMYREMVGYGIGPDLTATVSFPLAQGNTPLAVSRGAAGMLGTGKDVEASLLWRFQRDAPAVGERYESSLMVGAWDSGDARLDGLQAGQGITAAAVTGHASRTTYWWLGGGLQHYFPEAGSRLGDLYYVTAVWGWRPEYFRRDSGGDWRLFVEAVGEDARRDEAGGAALPDTGGRKLLAGPSVLGLFGAWGIELGTLFPLAQSVNGSQPKERYRTKFVFTYWF